MGGPVYTLDLSRPANRAKLKPVLNLCPVVLRDPRVQEGMHQTSEPSRLHFRGARNLGIERSKIEAMITHVAHYAGWPVAVSALRVLGEVWDEMDAQATAE